MVELQISSSVSRAQSAAWGHGYIHMLNVSNETVRKRTRTRYRPNNSKWTKWQWLEPLEITIARYRHHHHHHHSDRKLATDVDISQFCWITAERRLQSQSNMRFKGGNERGQGRTLGGHNARDSNVDLSVATGKRTKRRTTMKHGQGRTCVGETLRKKQSGCALVASNSKEHQSSE